MFLKAELRVAMNLTTDGEEEVGVCSREAEEVGDVAGGGGGVGGGEEEEEEEEKGRDRGHLGS